MKKKEDKLDAFWTAARDAANEVRKWPEERKAGAPFTEHLRDGTLKNISANERVRR